MAEDKVLKELLDELRGFRQDLSDKISTWSNNDNMSSKNIVKSYEAEREKFLEPYGGLDGLQERYRKLH